MKDRIPLNAQAGSLAGWNATTKQYTIQESGNYRVFTGACLVGTLPFPQVTLVALYLWPFQVLNKYEKIDNAVSPVLSSFWEGPLTAGAVVDLYVSSAPNGGGPQNVNLSQGFLTIVKLAY